MVRFFVSCDELNSDSLVLNGENAAHAKVLRLKESEEILLCDGQGNEAVCKVESAEHGCYRIKIVERRGCASEAGILVSVYMALPKADKLEHVIQKATELGVYEIVTFPTSRCVSRPDEKSLKKKLERWQKIAASAAEQSGRGRIPDIVILPSYQAALERAMQADKAIIFYENEKATTLRQELDRDTYRTISLLSGPEGGFEELEIEQGRNAGLRICTLGRRILRCETAPLCALSAVMFHAGEF